MSVEGGAFSLHIFIHASCFYLDVSCAFLFPNFIHSWSSSICFYPVDSFCFPNFKKNPNFIQELKFVQVGYSFYFLFKVESLTAKDSLRYHLSLVVSLLTCCCLSVTLLLSFLLLWPIVVVVSLVCVLVIRLVVSLLW